jgi:flagellar biosynthesis protein FlhF
MKRLQASSEIAIHLILTPGYSSEQLNFFCDQYSHSQMASLIWTKLDETCIFGRIMNIAWKTELPISYLSYGPGLKKCSVSATQDNVWRLIFKKELPNGCKIATC